MSGISSGLGALGKISELIGRVMDWLAEAGLIKKKGQARLEDQAKRTEGDRSEVTDASSEHDALKSDADQLEEELKKP